MYIKKILLLRRGKLGKIMSFCIRDSNFVILQYTRLWQNFFWMNIHSNCQTTFNPITSKKFNFVFNVQYSNKNVLLYFVLLFPCQNSVYILKSFPLCWCNFISIHLYRDSVGMRHEETQRDSRSQSLVTLHAYMTKECFDWDLMGQCSCVHIHRHCVVHCVLSPA